MIVVGFSPANTIVKNNFCSPGSPSRISTNFSGTSIIGHAQFLLDERYDIVSSFLNARFDAKLGNPATKFTAHLLQLIPERKTGELQMKAQQLFDPSNKFPVFQLFEIVLYFSSNNLLSEDQTDTFLEWVIVKEYGELLNSFLQHRIPTICAFATRIMESAVRIVEPEFLGLLLRSSIDSRVLSGFSGGILLGTLCSSICASNLGRWSELAKMLLNHGADPNSSAAGGSCPLFWAMLWQSEEIVKLLVKSGADINARLYSAGGQTALAMAIRRGDTPLVLTLLELGAKVDNSYIHSLSVLEWSAIKSPRLYNVLLGKSKKSPKRFDIPGILYASTRGSSFLSSYLKQSHGLRKHEIQKMLECALWEVFEAYDNDSRLSCS